MVTNWSVIVARAQADQVKLQEFNFEDTESTVDSSTVYILIRSSIEYIRLAVTQYLFHISNASELVPLRPEAAIILQSCYENVTSWNEYSSTIK